MQYIDVDIEDSPTVEFAVPIPRHRADRLLTVSAVAGSICLIATVLALVFGVRPMIFETGSMAPTIPTGSLGLSHSVTATSIQQGDVVSVIRDDGVRVTHRVESVDGRTGNSVSLTLRGDANDVADSHTYVVTEVDRVFGTVPLLGYIAAWLKNPYTLALQALAILLLLAVAFAPKQGWRNSPAGQRILAGTAATLVVALGASTVHGTGDAHALTGRATATGAVTAGRPANPTSFTCNNITVSLLGIIGLFSSVELSWPNPAGNSRYQYELAFPGGQVEVLDASTLANPATFRVQGGLLQTLIALLLGGGTFSVRLTNTVGEFRSVSYLSQTIRSTTTLEIPAGIKCVTQGTVNGPAGAAFRAVPESAPGSPESADPGASEDSEAESVEPTETTTSETAELPDGGTLSDAGDYAYYESSGKVTIRSAETGDREYEGQYPPNSEIRWLPGTSTLEITEPDGTVTTVERDGNRWTETVVEPAAAGAKAPIEDSDAPSDSTPTPAATSVPSADGPAES
ncbi:signal peptidase I [Gordonia metallireducens]|uniref:signal peptidase I n=1 Tax=Gordonia metallireducens TaxID=2897779 RepID=UPI001E5BEE10|nr:signal peptidase I [Gordonia metallireducens]